MPWWCRSRPGQPSWLLCNDHVPRINREIFDSVVIVRRETDCSNAGSNVWEQYLQGPRVHVMTCSHLSIAFYRFYSNTKVLDLLENQDIQCCKIKERFSLLKDG